MKSIHFLFLVLLSMFMCDVEAQTGCQDLDSAACVAMARQNTALCADHMLAKSACPAYCKLCPLTCYNCNTTRPDVNNCNTVTCAMGETCLLRTSGSGTTSTFSMQCGAKTTCSNGRKRDQKYSDVIDIQSRDATNNVVCCDSDLCNSPATLSSTVPPPPTTKTTTTTTAKPYACKRDIIIMIDRSQPMASFTGEIKSVLTDFISHLDIGTDKTLIAMGTFGRVGSKQWGFDSGGISHADKGKVVTFSLGYQKEKELIPFELIFRHEHSSWYNDRNLEQFHCIYVDKASLLSAVNSLHGGTWAMTGNNLAAVELVLQNFNQGNRPSVPDDVIFISEGHSYHFFSHNKEDAAIRALHQMSNNVISVAMGGANQNELRQIASDNSHFIYIPDYNQFDQNNVVSKLLNLVCN